MSAFIKWALTKGAVQRWLQSLLFADMGSEMYCVYVQALGFTDTQNKIAPVPVTT